MKDLHAIQAGGGGGDANYKCLNGFRGVTWSSMNLRHECRRGRRCDTEADCLSVHEEVFTPSSSGVFLYMVLTANHTKIMNATK